MLPIAIKLDDGGVLRVRMSPDDLDRAFHAAMTNDVMLRITNGDGEILAINPQRILYWTSALPPEEGDDALWGAALLAEG
jgi:hypothetical protein